MQVSTVALARRLVSDPALGYGGAFVQDDWKVTHRLQAKFGHSVRLLRPLGDLL